jgi:hypothetical protein
MTEIKTKRKIYNFNKVKVIDGHGEIFNFYDFKYGFQMTFLFHG